MRASVAATSRPQRAKSRGPVCRRRRLGRRSRRQRWRMRRVPRRAACRSHDATGRCEPRSRSDTADDPSLHPRRRFERPPTRPLGSPRRRLGAEPRRCERPRRTRCRRREPCSPRPERASGAARRARRLLRSRRCRRGSPRSPAGVVREPETPLVSWAAMTEPQPQKILVAVAWPYANGPRHIGHVAGFGVPADIFARYHRLRGNDVLMVSGTDEHGTPVMVAADEEGVSPRELADRYNEVIRNDLRRLGLSYDLFTRTTTENHHEVVRDVFRTLYEKGFIVEQTTVGAFSAATGRTLPDRYIEGTCPICGFPHARGDQCDNCGNQLDPADLIEPRSKIDGTPPVFKETSHLFLDLPAFKEQLADVDRRAGALALERPPLLARARQEPEAASGHARSRLGRSRPGPGLRGARGQAHLRLDRRRHRLPLRGDRVGAQPRHARRLARLVAEPRRAPLLLHGEGQHRLPQRDLARSCSATARAASSAPGAAGSSCRTTSSAPSS